MAGPTILPQRNAGTAIGQGLASGIESLMGQQVQRMQAKQSYDKKVRGLKALGIPNAEEVAHLDDKTLEHVIKDHLERMGNTSQYNQGLQPNADQYVEQPQQFEQPQQQPQEQPQQYKMLEQLAGQQPPIQSAAQQAMNLGGPRPQFNPEAQQAQAGNPFMKQQAGFPSAAEQAFNLGHWQRPEQKPMEPEAPKQAIARTAPLGAPEVPLKPKQPSTNGMTDKQKAATLKQYNADLKEWHKAKDDAFKQQEVIDKETKDAYEQVLAYEEVADKADKRLNKMENLVKKGGLPIALFYKTFKNLEESTNVSHAVGAGAYLGKAGGIPGVIAGAGLGLVAGTVGSALRYSQKYTSPNTEEFEKLTSDFVKDAKAIFGARITDNDLAQFMKMIPTLENTDAGKLAIINNMRIFNKSSKIKAQAMKDIIKENRGQRPRNLLALIEERTKTELDELAAQFESV